MIRSGDLNTEDIISMMKNKYKFPTWSLFFEVANKNADQKRRADAVAINLNKSRGYEINGFEFKASRIDWLHELRNGDKAEHSLWKYCDKWWIVAPYDIIKTGELPKGWGLMCPNDSHELDVVVDAECNESPELSRQFMTIMLHACHKYGSKIFSEGCDKGRDDAKLVEAALVRDIEKIQKRIQRFEDEVGIRVSNDGAYKELRLQVREFVSLRESLRKARAIDAGSEIYYLRKKRAIINKAIQSLKKFEKQVPRPNSNNDEDLAPDSKA